MKNIKYLLLFVVCFMFVGIVSAEDISMDSIIEELKKDGSTANYTDGKLVVSKEGKSTTYDYDSESNVLSYTDTESTSADQAISKSTILQTVVKLSSNYANYTALKASKSVTVKYGEGCDLENMGVCYTADSKKMEISLTNTFTTYLIQQYSGEDTSDDDTIEDTDDSMAKVVDPTQQESTYAEGEAPTGTVQPTTEGDAKNPTTGSFAEYGVVFGLAALLLVVIILKKRNETEYDL